MVEGVGESSTSVPQAVVFRPTESGKNLLPEKHQEQIDDFLQLHAQLFGITDDVEAATKPGIRLHQYGPVGMFAPASPNKKIIIDYLTARGRALFLAAKVNRKSGKREEYERLMGLRRNNRMALRATRGDPKGPISQHRIEKLLTIFQEVVDQTETQHAQSVKPWTLALLSNLVPLLTPGLNQRLRRIEVAVIGKTRAEEVLEFVKKTWVLESQSESDVERTYDAFRVKRKK